MLKSTMISVAALAALLAGPALAGDDDGNRRKGDRTEYGQHEAREQGGSRQDEASEQRGRQNDDDDDDDDDDNRRGSGHDRDDDDRGRGRRS